MARKPQAPITDYIAAAKHGPTANRAADDTAAAERPNATVKKLHFDRETNALTLEAPDALDPQKIPVKLVRAGRRIGCGVLLETDQGFPIKPKIGRDAVNLAWAALRRAGGTFSFKEDIQLARDPETKKLWLFAFRDQLDHVSRHAKS